MGNVVKGLAILTAGFVLFSVTLLFPIGSQRSIKGYYPGTGYHRIVLTPEDVEKMFPNLPSAAEAYNQIPRIIAPSSVDVQNETLYNVPSLLTGEIVKVIHNIWLRYNETIWVQVPYYLLELPKQTSIDPLIEIVLNISILLTIGGPVVYWLAIPIYSRVKHTEGRQLLLKLSLRSMLLIDVFLIAVSFSMGFLLSNGLTLSNPFLHFFSISAIFSLHALLSIAVYIHKEVKESIRFLNIGMLVCLTWAVTNLIMMYFRMLSLNNVGSVLDWYLSC